MAYDGLRRSGVWTVFENHVRVSRRELFRIAMRTILSGWSAQHSPDERESAAPRDNTRILSRLSGAGGTLRRTTTARHQMARHARAGQVRTLTLLRHRRPGQAHHHRSVRPREELAYFGRGQRHLDLRALPQDEGLPRHGLQRVHRTYLTTWLGHERLCTPETAPMPLARTLPDPRR